MSPIPIEQFVGHDEGGTRPFWPKPGMNEYAKVKLRELMIENKTYRDLSCYSL